MSYQDNGHPSIAIPGLCIQSIGLITAISAKKRTWKQSTIVALAGSFLYTISRLSDPEKDKPWIVTPLQLEESLLL